MPSAAEGHGSTWNDRRRRARTTRPLRSRVRVGPALAEPAGPSTAGTPGRRCGCSPASLAAAPFRTVLTGDESLSHAADGARGRAAPRDGRRRRHDRRARAARRSRAGACTASPYTTPVPTAQVKSADPPRPALAAEGATTVERARATRDHTERALAALGAPVDGRGTHGHARAVPARRRSTARVPGRPVLGRVPGGGGRR